MNYLVLLQNYGEWANIDLYIPEQCFDRIASQWHIYGTTAAINLN